MSETYVLALANHKEQFIFRYDKASVKQLLLVLGRFASDPDINFTWYDAAVLSQRVRQEAADRDTESRMAGDWINPRRA